MADRCKRLWTITLHYANFLLDFIKLKRQYLFSMLIVNFEIVGDSCRVMVEIYQSITCIFMLKLGKLQRQYAAGEITALEAIRIEQMIERLYHTEK